MSAIHRALQNQLHDVWTKGFLAGAEHGWAVARSEKVPRIVNPYAIKDANEAERPSDMHDVIALLGELTSNYYAKAMFGDDRFAEGAMHAVRCFKNLIEDES